MQIIDFVIQFLFILGLYKAQQGLKFLSVNIEKALEFQNDLFFSMYV